MYILLLGLLYSILAARAFTSIDFENRIVGGSSIDIGLRPYQLSLESNGNFYCGAIIISQYWCLTAAHCLDGESGNILSVRTRSNIIQSGGIVYNVVQRFVHPYYNSNTYAYDLALLQISTGFTFQSGTAAISLPDSGYDPAINDLSYISGYGTTSYNGPLADNLQNVDVPIVSRTDCNNIYGDIDISMICAGYPQGGKDACEGDSGGPLTDNSILVGIVSWGVDCALPNYPGVYANVGAPEARNWIKTVTGI